MPDDGRWTKRSDSPPPKSIPPRGVKKPHSGPLRCMVPEISTDSGTAEDVKLRSKKASPPLVQQPVDPGARKASASATPLTDRPSPTLMKAVTDASEK